MAGCREVKRQEVKRGDVLLGSRDVADRHLRRSTDHQGSVRLNVAGTEAGTGQPVRKPLPRPYQRQSGAGRQDVKGVHQRRRLHTHRYYYSRTEYVQRGASTPFGVEPWCSRQANASSGTAGGRTRALVQRAGKVQARSAGRRMRAPVQLAGSVS